MKVVLRPWATGDEPGLVKIANNQNIWNNVRDRFPHPYSYQDALDFIQISGAKHPIENYCVEAEGVIAGSAGMMLFDQNHRKNIEIGYFIGQEFWGKGIATEAVRLLLLLILQNHHVLRIFAMVFEHNIPSMRVLEKNGFLLECVHKKAAIKNNLVLDEYVWVKFNTDHGDN